MSKAASDRASIVQTLIFSDGPQVVLFRTQILTYIIAIAVQDGKYLEPFYGAEISETQLNEYLQEKYDLRYLMSRPIFKRWFMIDLGKMEGDSVKLVKMQLTPSIAKAFLPGKGIFAREHTEECSLYSENNYAEDSLSVDGSWDLPEVSDMYKQYGDLYIVFNSADIFIDPHASADVKRKVVEAFNKPWEGGGSYGAFYHSMRDAQAPNERLRLAAMQYMSPGYVRIHGKVHPFHEVRRLIEHYKHNFDKINGEYSDLHKYLSQMNLLTLPANEFDRTGKVADEVAERAKKFAITLDAIPYRNLYAMAGQDQLTVAKVLLSIQRRLDHLYEFFLQGRVDFR